VTPQQMQLQGSTQTKISHKILSYWIMTLTNCWLMTP